MDGEQRSHLERLRHAHLRRLRILEQQAALAEYRATQSLALALRIGISTGLVLLGARCAEGAQAPGHDLGHRRW